MAAPHPSLADAEVTYEEFSDLEAEFTDVDNEIIRQHWIRSEPLFRRRKELISQIPHFWALVFEEAPPDVDHYISPSDSELFADCLQAFEAEKFELDVEPRSFILRFRFAPNKWFEDEVLEKRFWYRQTEDPWQGLVSEPVKIHWKQGYDLTKGLTDTVVAFWERFRAEYDPAVKGYEKLQSLPEYRNLANKALNSDPRESFFTFFSFISSYRYVSAEESEKAKQAEIEKRNRRREKRRQAESLDEPPTRHNSPSSLDESIMVCRHGEELAFVLLDEVWLHAYRYFRDAQGRDEASDLDFEAHSNSESSDEEPVDISSLVRPTQKRRKMKSSSDVDSPRPSSRVRTEPAT